jgi:hypothetical protein
MEHTSWAAEQCQRAQCVEIPPAGAGYCPQPGDLLFSLDVQYVGDQATVAWMSSGGKECTRHVRRWHSGDRALRLHFFCFREGPPL